MTPSKTTICLWYDRDAEAAARFYASVFPDTEVQAVHRAPADFPSGKAGDVLTVTFTLAGRSFAMLNGGAGPAHSEAMSLQVDCIDQAEVDHCWDAILANGGTEVACGWIKDRLGVAWQIVPRRLTELMQDPVHGPKAMQAMMAMVRIDVATLESAIAS